jgi:hypothetical protein
LSDEKAKQIAGLNDRFRLRFGIPGREEKPAVPGQIVAMRSVASLSPDSQFAIWEKVRNFDQFPEGDDPHGEHDFGAFDVAGVPQKIFWKIDYYADATCAFGSEDAADVTRCYRVLTIMLASDW